MMAAGAVGRDAAVSAAIEALDLVALERLAFAPGGFGAARRAEAWAALLGVDLNAPLDAASAAALSAHGDRSTVGKDVARSLWRFDAVKNPCHGAAGCPLFVLL